MDRQIGKLLLRQLINDRAMSSLDEVADAYKVSRYWVHKFYASNRRLPTKNELESAAKLYPPDKNE